MTYKRFEDLPVWQLATQLGLDIYALTRDRFFKQPGDLCDQLRRAVLSISNNIAEGFERGTTAALLAYLYIASGSAGEVRSMLIFCERLPGTEHLTSDIAQLKSMAERCSRQIKGWAGSLQNTDIKGQRHLNDKARQQYERKKAAELFEYEIAKNLHKSLPKIYGDPDVKK